MCSRNILIIIFQIVNNITLILQSNYRSNNAEIDKHFASILWMNRTNTDKSKNNHKIQNIREFSLMAQKTFLLFCDLYRLNPENKKDSESMVTASEYIEILSRAISNAPSFIKSQMDFMAKKTYFLAVNKLDERGWFSIKNDLVTCCGQIFYITTEEGGNKSDSSSDDPKTDYSSFSTSNSF